MVTSNMAITSIEGLEENGLYTIRQDPVMKGLPAGERVDRGRDPVTKVLGGGNGLSE